MSHKTIVVLHLKNRVAWDKAGVMGMGKSRKVQKILEECETESLRWDEVERKMPRLWPTGQLRAGWGRDSVGRA